METTAVHNYPSIVKRIQSTFIDALLIVALMFATAKILDQFKEVPNWVKIVLFFGMWGIYEPVCVAYACTIGNYFMNIRVRKFANTFQRINLFEAFVRYIFKTGLGWLSFLTVHTNKERRAIHDMVAGSVMIELE